MISGLSGAYAALKGGGRDTVSKKEGNSTMNTGTDVSAWLLTPWSHVPLVILTTVCVYSAIILLTRVNGLRSFSKMSGFDFAMTIAIGSLFATTIVTQTPPMLQGITALATIFACQRVVAFLRTQEGSFRRLIDNEPMLLMDGATVLHENLEKVRVTEKDLYGKLREANVVNLKQVRAVIFESTGDISVLCSLPDADDEISEEVLMGVQRQP